MSDNLNGAPNKNVESLEESKREFARALSEAFAQKYDEELAKDEEVVVSKRHKKE